MAIKVHGHRFSSATNRVLLCLAEKELDHEFIFVDLRVFEQRKQPFLSLNPFGQVPALEDGNVTLFESRAITKYISRVYHDKGTPLLSKDPEKNLTISVWLEVEAQRFNDVAQKISFELVVKPMRNMTRDPGLVDKLQPQLAAVLDVYEARLAKCKYLAGDSYTLVDLHHIPVVANLLNTKIKSLFEERPHVLAWCEEILNRPATKKVYVARN